MLNLDEYFQIAEDYDALAENDPVTAYNIMKRASSIKEYLDEQLATFVKEVIVLEKEAKGTEAKVSCELSSKPTDGARKALCDSRVLQAWATYARAVEMRDKLRAMSEFMERVYFDSKACYSRAEGKLTFNRNI